MSTPKITITYYSDQPPTVSLDSRLSEVEVVLIDGDREYLRFFTHSGVEIFRTWRRGHPQDPLSEYWYSTQADGDPESGAAFDIRDLPKVSAKRLASYRARFPDWPSEEMEDRARIANAIERALILAADE